LSDNTTFIYHVNPLQFNVEESDTREEIQIFIEETMLKKLNKCKPINLSVEFVVVAGGFTSVILFA
jgi:hypothetical protein